jgi:hypothetical protein
MYDPNAKPATLPLNNEQDFIQDIHPLQTPRRNPWVTRLIIAGWALIAAKSVFVWWACAHYALPFHPLWVIVPTMAFGALCTGVYLYARR